MSGWRRKQPPKLEDLFLKAAEVTIAPRLKCGIWGEPEAGKTYFALTCPEPIYVIDTEFGSAPIARVHFPDKDINIFEVRVVLGTDPLQVDVAKTLEQVGDAINALQNVEEGTIVVDSWSDIVKWTNTLIEETATYKTRDGRPYRFEWGRRNRILMAMIYRLFRSDANLIITAKERKLVEPETSKVIGTDARWVDDNPYQVDVVIHVFKEITSPREVIYWGEIEKCRFKRGLHFRIRDITYNKLIKHLREKLKLDVI